MGSGLHHLFSRLHSLNHSAGLSEGRRIFTAQDCLPDSSKKTFLQIPPVRGLCLLPSSAVGRVPLNRAKRSRHLRWRCCDASAAETLDPSVTSAEFVISDGASATSPPLPLPAEIPVVSSVESTERGILKSITLPDLSASEIDCRKTIPSTPDVSLDEKHPSTDGSGMLQFLNEDEEKNLLQQMLDIAKFAGPALGIWLSGPMMSLIDTAVVGNSSSLELAALGPGTVFCDQLGYVFMFLSIATSNLIATSLAKKDEKRAAGHLSRLLFVALACGTSMFLFTIGFAEPLLKGFVGPENVALTPAACSYIKIRGLAWPAVLVGMVAQSASLGMQDSWNPLKVLAVASFANLFGDIVLCTFLGYGISGAAWATMVSQYIGGYLMLKSLSKKGYSLNLTIPSRKELLHMIDIAAPVLLTMLSKVSFYAFITYLSTSLGAVILGAHQVMIGIYSTCTVSGEPLCQTAQSFMPGLIQGANPNLKKAKELLRSLLLIGAIFGVSLGCVGLCFPWVVPGVFTSDIAIIKQMREVTIPFLCALVITPPLLSLEGTLLAGRDLKFLSASMVSCFLGGSAMLLAFKNMGFGLVGFWWTLACFQTARFVASYTRLQSDRSVLKQPVKLS